MKVFPVWGLANITQSYSLLDGQLCNLRVFGEKIVEAAVYFARGGDWMYVALLVHVVVSMEVVLLLPFTKFAHAVYRPIALFTHNLIRSRVG